MGFGPTPAENGESTVRILREKNLKLQKTIKNGKEKINIRIKEREVVKRNRRKRGKKKKRKKYVREWLSVNDIMSGGEKQRYTVYTVRKNETSTIVMIIKGTVA